MNEKIGAILIAPSPPEKAIRAKIRSDLYNVSLLFF